MLGTVKIKLHEVGKKYIFAGEKEHHVLQAINLEIYEGELFCILGPSGCGKTTLLHLMAGYELPTTGNVTINGRDLTKPDPNYIVLFQNYGLFPWRSVLGNVEYGLEVKRVLPEIRREKARELISLVGLNGYADHLPRELSGGMQQRVAIARALAVDPDIIFMDEPFGALDAMTRLKMQDELVRIWQKKNKTIVLVTHDIGEAVYLADRVAVISSGQGRINSIIDIPIERPRLRSSHNFVMTQNKLLQELELSILEKDDYCI